MKICLYVDQSKIFRWHLWLAEALVSAKNEVAIRYSTIRRPLPKACTTLFSVEKLAYRFGDNGNAIDPITSSAFPCSNIANEPFDILIDLAADGTILPESKRIFTLFFNSTPTVIGAIGAILSNQRLIIELYDGDNSLCGTASPAVADRDILIRSLDNVLSCATGLLIKTLLTLPAHDLRVYPVIRQNCRSVTIPVLTHVIETIIRKSGRLLRIKMAGQCEWAIAWRHAKTSLLDSNTANFNVFPNQKDHFYADPFPFRHKHGDFIFVEDFNHLTGRGCISVMKIDGDQASVPYPIIEENWHLSYPCVFEHDGQIWMIPESSEARTMDLYRAESFPYRWKREKSLLVDVEVNDTTPLFLDDDLWLFSGQHLWNSTGWDALSLLHARALDQQWTPHEQNPILIDAALSRPAGAIFQRNGQYIRPVQDCSRLYGGSMRLCRIDHLSTDSFLQTLIGTIATNNLGCHTYNNFGGLEVIDIYDRGIPERVTASYQPVRNPLPKLDTMTLDFAPSALTGATVFTRTSS